MTTKANWIIPGNIEDVEINGRPVRYADEDAPAQPFRITRPGKYRVRNGEVVEIIVRDGGRNGNPYWPWYSHKSGSYYTDEGLASMSPTTTDHDIIAGPLDETAESAGLDKLLDAFYEGWHAHSNGKDPYLSDAWEIYVKTFTSANLVRREEQGKPSDNSGETARQTEATELQAEGESPLSFHDMLETMDWAGARWIREERDDAGIPASEPASRVKDGDTKSIEGEKPVQPATPPAKDSKTFHETECPDGIGPIGYCETCGHKPAAAPRLTLSEMPYARSVSKNGTCAPEWAITLAVAELTAAIDAIAAHLNGGA